MSAILTITLSPCIDKSFTVPALIPEKKLRCSAPVIQPGGGGINVARVLTRLGANPVALYPSGGYTGKVLNELMAKENIPVISVDTENETRESIIVLETSTQQQFRFTMPAPALKTSELHEIIERIEKMDQLDFVVVSGSIPADISLDLFVQINTIANKKKAKLIVDTSGNALKHAVDSGVWLIKPSIGELASLVDKEYLHKDEVANAAKEILKSKKCQVIIVSMNVDGAMLVTEEKVIQIAPPDVTVKSTVGAGDSMVAGIVFALSQGRDIQTALEYGVACGTAATLNAGTELCHREDVERLFKQIHSIITL